MQTTNENNIVFINTAQRFLATHKEDSKFNYALKRVIARAKKIYNKYQQLLEDIDVKHCIEKDGIVLRNGRGEFEFSREGLQTKIKLVRELLEKQVEIEPYISAEKPALSPEEEDAFEGFVIDETTKSSVINQIPIE